MIPQEMKHGNCYYIPMEELLSDNLWILLLVIWSLPWNGVALWMASRRSQKWWFVVMLVVDVFALVEIYYIFFVARKIKVEEEIEPTETPENMGAKH